jgi:hypothetical protein
MKRMKNWTIMLLVCLLALAGSACSSGVQKANGLVDEANKSIDEAKTLSESAAKKYGSAQDKVGPNFPADRDTLKAEAQEAVDGYDKASKKLKEASGKFEEAGKQSIPDSFRGYLTTEASEFAKRAEMLAVLKENAQAFLDAKDFADLKNRVDTNDARIALLSKDANELNEKAKKIQTDNPDMFKK